MFNRKTNRLSKQKKAACVLLAAAAFHAAVAATAGAWLPREDRPCSGCAWRRTPGALFPPAPALPETLPKLGCWSAPSLLAGERPRAALTCEGYADPNTLACVLSPTFACVRLFAAPVEAGYVTSSALLSRPPSQASLLLSVDSDGAVSGVYGVHCSHYQGLGVTRSVFKATGVKPQ